MGLWMELLNREENVCRFPQRMWKESELNVENLVESVERFATFYHKIWVCFPHFAPVFPHILG